jgi:hypothetical protein
MKIPLRLVADTSWDEIPWTEESRANIKDPTIPIVLNVKSNRWLIDILAEMILRLVKLTM